MTDFLNEEWQFDRADFASAKATTENGAEAVEIDLTDSGKTKLTEAHNKVKTYLADSKNDADKAVEAVRNAGEEAYVMGELVKSDEGVIIC